MKKLNANILFDNKIIIGVIIFTLILLLVAVGKNSNHTSVSDDLSYKNEDIYFENLTLKQGLEYINLKEKELHDYFINEIQADKRNDALLRFLVLLENYTVSFNDKLSNMYSNEKYEESITTFNSDLNHGKSFIFEGIEFKGILKEKKEEQDHQNIKYISIISPKTDLIKIVYAGEGFFESAINYENIANNYSQYVTEDLKKYLEIKKKIEQNLNNGAYIQDGYVNATLKELSDWIIKWEFFKKEYPDNVLTNYIKEDLHNYTYDFLCSEAIGDSIWMGGKLEDNTINEYKKFLLSDIKNAESYLIIKDFYNFLKSQDFMINDEYYNKCADIRNRYNLPARH